MPHFLTVDDSKPIQHFLCKLLERYGSCDQAFNARDGITYVENSLSKGPRYDVVFMDIMMPGMNGKDAVRAIRRIEAEAGIHAEEATPVIMLSCLDDCENILEAQIECGAQLYLTKPVEPEGILQVLQGLGVLDSDIGFDEV